MPPRATRDSGTHQIRERVDTLGGFNAKSLVNETNNPFHHRLRCSFYPQPQKALEAANLEMQQQIGSLLGQLTEKTAHLQKVLKENRILQQEVALLRAKYSERYRPCYGMIISDGMRKIEEQQHLLIEQQKYLTLLFNHLK